MAMVRGRSTAVLGIAADLSAERADLLKAARSAGAITANTTASPIATASSNSCEEDGSNRFSRDLALIVPQPLTKTSIFDNEAGFKEIRQRRDEIAREEGRASNPGATTPARSRRR